MIWWWGMPSRSISFSWSRISFGSRATLPQRARVAAENGLTEGRVSSVEGDVEEGRVSGVEGTPDSWVCGLLRISEVVVGLWFFVVIGFVCVVWLLVKSQSPTAVVRRVQSAPVEKLGNYEVII